MLEEIREHLEYQNGELLLVERFDDIRRKDGSVQILVNWKGFSENELDWVDLTLLKEDVPVFVPEFLYEIQSNETQRQRRLIHELDSNIL